MNYNDACIILDFSEEEELTCEILKRRYRQLALKYHPDKTQTGDSSQFVKINDAYNYLMNIVDMGHKPAPVDDYKSLLFLFLKDILLGKENLENIKEKWLYLILFKITGIYDKPLLEFLNIVSVDIIIKIYEIVNMYKEVLHIPDEFITKIGEIMENKRNRDECVVLNPFIEDLMENHLYKLTDRIIIPLWHHELVYDISGRDLYVQCCPLLPDNITIDNNNNIIVRLSYNIKDIFGKKEISFYIGTQPYLIHMKDVMLIKTQQIVLKECGISKINVKNIFDITKKSDVIVILQLDI